MTGKARAQLFGVRYDCAHIADAR